MKFKTYYNIEELSKKYNVDRNELQKGIKVEKEHTTDEKIAAKIALDHLSEDPKYYTKLIKAGL
jgi:hypothetical protein